jgi:hypothetical protein
MCWDYLYLGFTVLKTEFTIHSPPGWSLIPAERLIELLICLISQSLAVKLLGGSKAFHFEVSFCFYGI